MSYKKGTKVLVRPDAASIPDSKDCTFWVGDMNQFLGKVVTIRDYENDFDSYTLEEDKDEFNYISSWLVPLPANQYTFNKSWIELKDTITVVEGRSCPLLSMSYLDTINENLETLRSDKTDFDVYSIERDGVTIFEREV